MAGSRHDDFFGRRKGRPLRASPDAILSARLPALRIDIETPPPDDLRQLFPVTVDTVRLEIGFGGGEHLLHAARAEPATGFIGVEPFINGMAKCVAVIDREGIENTRLYDADAGPLLAWLPDRSLARIDLLYPDPWPKRRHWKRRFVSTANLAQIARILRPGGEFRFATDIEHYANWTLNMVWCATDLGWVARTADDWRAPWPGWPGTRYETKAIAEMRKPAYFIFQKKPDDGASDG